MTESNSAKTSKNLMVIISLVALVVVAGAMLFYQSVSTTKLKTIGVARWSGDSEFGRSIEGFKQGLAENGYVEGENVKFIIENPEANLDRQHEIIQSFIDDEVDLIFSLTTPGTLVAMEMTNMEPEPIPVVFSVCTYPVESGLVASLDSSENNLVGTRNYVPFAQQYYAFEQVFADTQTLAVVRREGESNSTNQLIEIREALEPRHIKIVDIAAVDLEDIRQQLSDKIDSIDAIFSTCDTLTHSGGDEIIAEFSQRYKKPSFACNKEGVIKGQLLGNIGDFKAIAKISGEKAALILNGAKPAWLSTESPRENYIVLNDTTAKTLGLEISQEVIASVKEIVH